MTEQPSEQWSSERLSGQELDFLDLWRRLVDQAGGPAKVIRNLQWGKSTVYRNYGGQYLPSDEWATQLCTHLQLPDQELVAVLGRLCRARESRQARRADEVHDFRGAGDKPGDNRIEQWQSVVRDDAVGVPSNGRELRERALVADSRHSRKASWRVVAAVVAFIVIVASAGLWWYQTAHSSGTTCQSFGREKFAVLIPASCLSPTLAANVGQGQKSTNTTVTGFLFENGADSSLCLSVNTAGATAGENRDRVQVANCSYTDEEIWIPVQRGSSGRKSTWLVNYRYQSKCLNADIIGGLHNGHRVQLWDCYDASNEYWDFGDWYATIDRGINPNSIYLESGKFCLDADKYDLRDGDQVHIWTAYGARNQLWS